MTGRNIGHTQQEDRALIKSTVEPCQAEQDILFDDVSDEALEASASTSGAAQSLWGSFTVSGCTCIE